MQAVSLDPGSRVHIFPKASSLRSRFGANRGDAQRRAAHRRALGHPDVDVGERVELRIGEHGGRRGPLLLRASRRCRSGSGSRRAGSPPSRSRSSTRTPSISGAQRRGRGAEHQRLAGAARRSASARVGSCSSSSDGSESGSAACTPGAGCRRRRPPPGRRRLHDQRRRALGDLDPHAVREVRVDADRGDRREAAGGRARSRSGPTCRVVCCSAIRVSSATICSRSPLVTPTTSTLLTATSDESRSQQKYPATRVAARITTMPNR